MVATGATGTQAARAGRAELTSSGTAKLPDMLGVTRTGGVAGSRAVSREDR